MTTNSSWPSTPEELMDRGWPEDDIFLEMPFLPTYKRTYVVGSGPNGGPFHQYIPEIDSCNIALNRAILIDKPWDWWIVFDPNATEYDWFHQGARKPRVGRLFGSEMTRRRKCVKPDYTFQVYPSLHGRSQLLYGVLHGCTSSAGPGIQMAKWQGRGCKDIVLVGIDQFGENDWDGFVSAPRWRGKKWRAAKELDSLVSILRGEGVMVRSLSPTKLKVPVVEPGGALDG